MIIPVRLEDGAEDVEWVLLELQGVLETPKAATPHGLPVGAVTYNAVSLRAMRRRCAHVGAGLPVPSLQAAF